MNKILTQKFLVGVLVFVSICAYFNFGGLFGNRKGFVHYYEFAAYYLGSKYYPELGRHDLYVAFMAAISEDGDAPDITVIRDLKSNEPVRMETVQGELETIHNRFTFPRWEDFKRDSAFFEYHFGDNLEDFVQDHGYNPTPVWTMAGHTLTNTLKSLGCDTKMSVHLLSLIDLVLLAGLFIVVYWAYGSSAAALCLVFWSVNPFEIFNYSSGAFLRQDWLFCTVAAVCLFKKERFVLAGILFAYAVGVRIFPAVFAIMPAFHFARMVFREKRMDISLLKFGSALAVTFLTLVVFSSVVCGGFSSWPKFYDNIKKHNNGVFTNHVSLKSLFLIEFHKTKSDYSDVNTYWRREKERRLEHCRPVINVMAVALFGLFLYAFRDVSPLKGMQASCFLPFLFFYPANYYFSFLLLLVLYLYDERPEYLRGFFVLMVCGSLARIFVRLNDVFYTYLSYLVLLAFVLLLVSRLQGQRSGVQPSERLT